METKLIGAFVFVVAWILSMYFYRQIYFQNKYKYLECILAGILMGVSSWVMQFLVGMLFSVILVALLIVIWWIKKKIES